uniref:RNA-dependent RNA polymerase n=1 Tax=Shayang bunya-like virus 1 TaxID=1923461 RepID=A0A1L3KPM6_9VIRU|nr:RNA-dependent RNA polymerase [Shayang bunya-like virus 1]
MNIVRDFDVSHAPHPYVQTATMLRLPPCDVKVTGSFEFEFRVLPFEEGAGVIQRQAGSTTLREQVRQVVGADNIRAFKHNFTFEILAQHTDVSLSRIFPGITMIGGEKTPDFAVHRPESLIIIEFMTYHMHEVPQSVWRLKSRKYDTYIQERVKEMERLSLTRRVKRKYAYHTIIVTPTKSYSTIELDQDLVNELCARYRFTQQVYEQLRSSPSGMIPPTDEETERETRLTYETDALRSMDMRFAPKDTFGMTEQRYLDLMNEKESDPVMREREMFLEYERLRSSKEREVIDDLKNGRTVKFSEDEYNEFYENWKKELATDTRKHLKCVSNYPLFCVDVAKFDGSQDLFNFRAGPYRDDMPTEVWIWGSMTRNLTHAVRFDYLDEPTIERRISESSDNFTKVKRERAQHRRFICYPMEEQAIDLAMKGVHGKRFANHPVVEKNTIEKKKPLDFDIDVTDIEEWIMVEAQKFYSKEVGELSVATCLKRELIEHSTSVHEAPLPISVADHEYFYYTQGFRYHECLTAIGLELAAMIQFNQKEYEWIVKKVPDFDIFIIARTVNSSKTVFYSLAVPKRGNNQVYNMGPFRKWMNGENFWCTEICSINESRLQNLVTSNSIYINAFAQWYRFFGGNLYNYEPPVTMWPTFAFQMLIALEDKAMTEEVVTLWRYIEMEKLKSRFAIPKPYKIFKKMPTIFRSRLQIWVVKRLIPLMKPTRYDKRAIAIRQGATDDEQELSSTIESNLPEEEERIFDQLGIVTEGQIVWTGCKNFIDGRPLSGPEKFMEIMYIGYQKNKLEVSPENQDAKMVAKILKCEEQKKECRNSHMGAFEFYRSEDFKMHEYCGKSVVYVADKIKGVLKQVLGENWQNMISNEVERELYALSWEKLATLKASSMNYPGVIKPRTKQGRIVLPRQRLLERIINHVCKNDSSLLSQLPSIVEYLEAMKGIHADLFKKMQHGGLREIFVMIMEGRLVQASIEVFARVVCRYIESETIVNPDNKSALPIKHAKMREMKKEGRSVYTCNSSNDATTWNQTNYVTKFAMLLCCIFPSRYHAFIIRAMELFRHKHILLPPGVIHVLEEHANTPFTNEALKKLVYFAKHPRECDFLDFETNEMIIETGFMQGILHVNSSLWHAGVLLARESLFRLSLHNKQISDDIISTDLVSSDDSARMVTLLAPNDSNIRYVLEAMSHIVSDQQIMDVFYKRFGIILSEKSATCTEHTFEFNSEFYFGASLYRPVVKWAIASVAFHEVESFYARLEAFYNLLQEAIENGCSITQARSIQISQAFCHYSLLGLNNSEARLKYVEIIKKTHDPSFGFFLMDHPYAVGISGLKYNYWLTVKKNDILRNRINKLITNKEITTTSSATLTTCVAINFGSRIKWRKIVKRCEKTIPNWEEIIESKPVILYTRPEKKEEILARMMVKLTDPGVTNSLSSTTSLTKMAASAMYVLDHPCVKLGSLWYESVLTDEPNKLTRLSLIAAARLMAEEDKDICEFNREPEVFPLYEQYAEYHQNLSAWCEDMEMLQLSPLLSTYRHRTKLLVFTDMSESTISLEDTCKYKWFGEQNMYSKDLNDEIWEDYKKRIPWLRDTADDTLHASPFKNHIQLRNYVAQETSKTRCLNLIGSPFFSSASHSSIIAMISRNFAPGRKVPTSKVDLVRGKLEEIRSIQHALRMVTCGPFLEPRKLSITKMLLRSVLPVWKGEAHGIIHTKLMILSVLQRFAQGDYTNTLDLLRDIRKSRRGIFGFFTKFGIQYKERKAERAGPVTWDGEIGSVRVRINFLGDKLQSVYTNDLHRFYQQEVAFLTLLKELQTTGIISDPSMDDRRGVVEFERNAFKISCASYLGAPIYVVDSRSAMKLRDLTDLISKFDLSSLKLTVTAHEVKLKLQDPERVITSEYKIPQKKPEYTVLTYSCTDSDLCKRSVVLPEELGLTTFEDCWIKNLPMSADLMMNMIRKLMTEGDDTLTRMGLHKEEFTSILRMHAKRLMEQRGFIPKTTTLSDEVATVSDEEVIKFIQGLSEYIHISDMDISSIMRNVTEDVLEPIITEEEELLAQMDAIAEQEVKEKKARRLYGAYETLTEEERLIAQHTEVLGQTYLEGLMVDASAINLYKVKDERLKMRSVLTFHQILDTFIYTLESEHRKSLERFGKLKYKAVDDPELVRIFEFLLEKPFSLDTEPQESPENILESELALVQAQLEAELGGEVDWAEIVARDEEVRAQSPGSSILSEDDYDVDEPDEPYFWNVKSSDDESEDDTQ